MAEKWSCSKLYTPLKNLLIKKIPSGGGEKTLLPLPKMNLRMLPLSGRGSGKREEDWVASLERWCEIIVEACHWGLNLKNQCGSSWDCPGWLTTCLKRQKKKKKAETIVQAMEAFLSLITVLFLRWNTTYPELLRSYQKCELLAWPYPIQDS